MSRNGIVKQVVTVAALCSALTPIGVWADSGSAAPPPDLPPGAFRLVEPLRKTLPNGLKVVVQPSARVPLVSVRLGVNAGSSAVPPGMAGVDQIVAKLITTKTRKYDENKLQEYVANLGGEISCASERDFAMLSATGLARNTASLLDVVAEVVQRPVLEQDALRGVQLSIAMQVANGSIGAGSAGGRMARALYGKHPYGAVPESLEQVKNLSPDRVRAFHKERYAPDGAVLVVVGDVNPAEVMAHIEKAFATWKPTGARPPKAAELDLQLWNRVWLLDKPKATQATILVANVTPRVGDADAAALDVANAILGGKADSRLFNTVREKYGYAYSINSQLRNDALSSEFVTVVECRNNVVAPTIKAILKEVETLQNTPPDAAELERAKTYAISEFAHALASQETLSDLLFSASYFNRPADYVSRYAERVRKVTAEDVQRVTRQNILPGRAAIVVMGDKARLEYDLEKVGYLQKDTSPGSQ